MFLLAGIQRPGGVARARWRSHPALIRQAKVPACRPVDAAHPASVIVLPLKVIMWALSRDAAEAEAVVQRTLPGSYPSRGSMRSRRARRSGAIPTPCTKVSKSSTQGLCAA